jgi:Zn-finger nucleic acid-binding protein
MECPVCDNGLTRMTVGGIAVDVCEGSCAGIWFDRYELMRADEADESAGEGLLEIERDPNLEVDLSKRLNCPKCLEVVMLRHFFSAKRRVVVDECPDCGGHWLDPGELRTIRTEYASAEERERAASQYFDEVFGPELAAAHAQTEDDLARARRIAHAFRFICPSYYVPGKQDWGSY